MIKKDLTLPGLVHDLNNVFQTLIDAAVHLSEDPQRAPLAEAILRSVERGQRISLSLQSVESPGASLASILDDAIAFLQDARLVARGPKILFQSKIDDDIKLRRNWAWERVLINLLLNSARAMPEGGTVEVEAWCDGPNFVIAVRDSGTGIPPGASGPSFPSARFHQARGRFRPARGGNHCSSERRYRTGAQSRRQHRSGIPDHRSYG